MSKRKEYEEQRKLKKIYETAMEQEKEFGPCYNQMIEMENKIASGSFENFDFEKQSEDNQSNVDGESLDELMEFNSNISQEQEGSESISNMDKSYQCICSKCPPMWPRIVIKDTSKYFVYVELKSWLQFLVPQFYDKLRFNQASSSTSLHDIYDGSEYVRLQERDKLMKDVNNDQDCLTITITIGYDGVTYTNDGKKSMWPIVGYINELPFNYRFNNEMILTLYASKVKPPNSIFAPLIDELVQYDKCPIEIIVQGKRLKFYVRLLCVIADAPARADILNFNLHNAVYGCHFCYVCSKHDKDTNSSLYPLSNFDSPLRTNSEWKSDVEKLTVLILNNPTKKIKPIRGIKGDCQLSRLEYVQLNVIAPQEYMHSQLIGTFKIMFSYWTGQLDSRFIYLSENQLLVIDSILERIKFPSGQLRPMIQLLSNASFKAFDYEVFLLYGFLALEDILDMRLYNNLLKFVKIISLLIKRNISNIDLQLADTLVREFLSEFSNIYPKKMHRYVVHTLVHLPMVVRLYGPLVGVSSFLVENTMGTLSRRVETATAIPQQVMNKSIMACSISAKLSANTNKISEKLMEYSEEVIPNIKSVFDKKTSLQREVKDIRLSENEMSVLSNFKDNFDEIKFYNRICYNGNIITTTKYRNLEKTANNIIKAGGKYFKITKILHFPSLSKIKLLGLCYNNPVIFDPDFFYIHEFLFNSGQIQAIDIEEFEENCFQFIHDNRTYIKH
ncbi:hypothetical protein BLOT_016797 [Blomia tropicalis]|nr:hypothetical protein BLOT_016797 [Blomia tropicalis]